MRRHQAQRYQQDQKSQERHELRSGDHRGRNLQKHNSNGYYKEHLTDENKSVMIKGSLNRAEKKYVKVSSQKSRKQESENNILKEHSNSVNLVDGFPSLKDQDINCNVSKTKSNYKKINEHKNLSILNEYTENKYPELRKQGIRNAPTKHPKDKIDYNNQSPPLNHVHANSVLVKAETNTYTDTTNCLSTFQNYDVMTGESNKSSECNNNQKIKHDSPHQNKHFNVLPLNNVCLQNNHITNSKEENGGVPDNFQKIIPFNTSVSYEGIIFSNCELTDLLYYNVYFMQGQQIFDYAFALRCKILEKIHEFKVPQRDEIEFLCAITDGTQTERNQRIITARTCIILNNILLYKQLPQMPPVQRTQYSSQMSGFPIANPPQMSGFPIANPPQMSGFPIANPPQISGFPIVNLPQKPGFRIANPAQISEFRTTLSPPETSEQYINNGQHVSEKNDSRLGADPELNRLSEHSNSQNVEYVILNENVYSYDNRFAGDHEENTQKYHINPNSTYENNANASSTSNTDRNAYLVNEVLQQNCIVPTINSEDSVSINTTTLSNEDSTFSNFGLDNLLHYDVESMQGNLVLDYAYAMKDRILENIHEFSDLIQDKLKFMCELTDGTQTEGNQKLIIARMCHLINEDLQI